MVPRGISETNPETGDEGRRAGQRVRDPELEWVPEKKLSRRVVGKPGQVGGGKIERFRCHAAGLNDDDFFAVRIDERQPGGARLTQAKGERGEEGDVPRSIRLIDGSLGG